MARGIILMEPKWLKNCPIKMPEGFRLVGFEIRPSSFQIEFIVESDLIPQVAGKKTVSLMPKYYQHRTNEGNIQIDLIGIYANWRSELGKWESKTIFEKSPQLTSGGK